MQAAPVFVRYTPCCAIVSSLCRSCVQSPSVLFKNDTHTSWQALAVANVLYPSRANRSLECSFWGRMVLGFS